MGNTPVVLLIVIMGFMVMLRLISVNKAMRFLGWIEVDPMSRPIFAFFKLHSDLVMQDDFVLFCINYLT